MDLTEMRRKAQLDFLASKKNIIVGHLEDLPLDLETIKHIDHTNYVLKHIDSGLTSLNYNIQVDGKFYNVKIKRDHILVENPDGQTSFLNEVQRRSELEILRKENTIINQGIVKTIYANLNEGIIVSEFIDGIHPKTYEKKDLENFFELLFELDIHGFFEWDLCQGNIMRSKDQFKLFDFGYMYKYNPLTEFNNNGLKDHMFHPIERFETRYYMHHLASLPKDEGFKKFQTLKMLTVDYFEKKIVFLKSNQAKHSIIDTYQKKADDLKSMVAKNKLYDLFIKDIYRSTALDILDDISGKSCTASTLKKVDDILELINTHFPLLSNEQTLLESDQLPKLELIKQYEDYKVLISTYRID